MNQNLLKQFKITGLILFIIAPAACARGQVQAVKFEPNQNTTIIIGPFENRDVRYSPFTVRNFDDMLSYQFREVGYEVENLKDLPADKNREKTGKTTNKRDDNDSTRNLLPAHLRQVAGEQRPRPPEERDTLIRLSPEEIRALHQKRAFTYFVQGSVSQSDADPLLEIKRNILVLITIYNGAGKRVGALSFTAEGEEMNGSAFMKNVCRRISVAFERTIHHGLSRKPWYQIK